MKIYRILGVLLSLVMVMASAHLAHAEGLDEQPSGEYKLDLTHASIVWKVNHLGLSEYVGRFNKFDATLQLDTEAFSNSSVVVDIDTASLDTDYPNPEEEDFNEKLITSWFDGAEFPKITFASTSVSDLNGDSFTIEGDLTLLGKTLPVTLDAKLNGAMASHPFKKIPAVGFGATTTIDRSAWGLDNFVPNIGAEVKIEIQGEFFQGS